MIDNHAMIYLTDAGWFPPNILLSDADGIIPLSSKGIAVSHHQQETHIEQANRNA